MFVNTLVLRNFPTPNKTFPRFLEEIKENFLQAFDNQDYPFEELVEKVAIKRDTRRNPLFDVMFQFNNFKVEDLKLPGLVLKPNPDRPGISRFDLTLWGWEREERLTFAFEYSTQLFKRETIDRFIRYFREIIASICSAPEKSLAQINRISKDNKQEILETINQQVRAQSGSMTGQEQVLQHRLNRSLAKFENKIAVESGPHTLTYSQLDEYSNRIARRIRSMGIPGETLIGILADDRMTMIGAVLGILKARCVFVPLDTSQPRSRLELMISSTETRYILAGHDHAGFLSDSQLPQSEQPWIIPIVSPIRAGEPVETESDPVPYTDYDYRSSDKIYIYFTSGSTGTPKAILGRNVGLTHFIDWEIHAFGIDESWRFSQLTTPGFDAFLRDVFVPLTSGGVVCIPPDKEIQLEGTRLLQWLESARINLVSTVPGMFRLLASRSLTPENLKELQVVLLSGEPITASDLEDWFPVFNERVRLANLWGTSETTLAKTCHIIREEDLKRERIPVGCPIPGAAVMALTPNLELCDPLVTGQLYIRTPFRSFGYYNDAPSNQSRFIPNPFGGEPDDLLHKTGDIGRILLDGSIDLLGRNDRQIKIRGIRIEPGEIENTLGNHPSVKEAAVLKTTNSRNDEFLCGYITETNKDEIPDPMALTLYLEERLPRYMVPAFMIKVDSMPRNPNGKINYKNLPLPVREETKVSSAPRNSIQDKLLELWAEILETEPELIRIDSVFFQLGGHSLNTMSLISKIHQSFDVRIPLGEIFNNPTIEKQARLISSAQREQFSSIHALEKKEYYDVSYAQRRVWALSQIDEASIAFNMPTALTLTGKLDFDVLTRVFHTLIERHENLRTVFFQLNNDIRQKILSPEDTSFQFDFIDLREFSPEEQASKVNRLTIETSTTPFNLGTGPLLRGSLLQFKDSQYLFLFNIHHISSDFLSSFIIMKELFTLYFNYKNGRENPLTPLRIHYKDYAAWQNDLLVGDYLEQYRSYWLRVFTDAPPVLDLPYDKPRPGNQTYNGDIVELLIPPSLTTTLRNICHSHDVTLFMTLLATLKILLYLYTGETDIVVGIPISGREHADLEPQIGYFLNTLPLYTQFAEEDTFLQLLAKVKDVSLGAFEHQLYPFDKLVEDLEIRRDTSRHPLFDIMVDMPNRLHSKLPEIDDQLTMVPAETGKKSCKFDLTFYIGEGENDIRISLEYNTDIFERKTVERMSQRLLRLLEDTVENHNTVISDFDLESATRTVQTIRPGSQTKSRPVTAE